MCGLRCRMNSVHAVGIGRAFVRFGVCGVQGRHGAPWFLAQFGIHRRPRRTKTKQRAQRNAAVIGVGKVVYAGSWCRRGVARQVRCCCASYRLNWT